MLTFIQRHAFPVFFAASLFSACDADKTLILTDRTSYTGSLDHDYFVVPSTGLAKSIHELTVGDGPNGEQLLFVNFGGASITRIAKPVAPTDPADDGRSNKSWIPNTFAVGNAKAFPAFDPSPYTGFATGAAQAKIVTYVTDWYAAYNVQVVTARPTAGKRYTMVMVGGVTADWFVDPNLTKAVGIAPLDCSNSSQNNIGFSFAGSLLPMNATLPAQEVSLALIAQTIAHESGHSFGLEHVNHPPDIMNPSVDPSVMGFLGPEPLSDAPNVCGTGTTQDSNQRLLSNLGPAASGPSVPRPIITVLAPINGAKVPIQFTVAVHAVQPTGAAGTITKVEFTQNAITQATFTNPPYQQKYDATGIVDGTIAVFTAIAYNSLGGKSSVSTQFTISNTGTQGPIPCTGPVDCTSKQTCSGNVCVDNPMSDCTPACTAAQTCSNGTCVDPSSIVDMSMPTIDPVVVGTVCEDSLTCGDKGVCATTGSKKYCTVACDPAINNACPAMFRCTAVGSDHYCAPESKGCSMSSSDSSTAAPFFLLALYGFVLRRRRASVT